MVGSYSHVRGPGFCFWFSDRFNCSHWSFEATVLPINPDIWIDSWESIVIYHYINLSLYNYNWHLDSCYCRTRCRHTQLRVVLSPLHLPLLGTFQSDIPRFTLIWVAKHSPNQGRESTHRLHLHPLGDVLYSISHRALHGRDLDFTSHLKRRTIKPVLKLEYFGQTWLKSEYWCPGPLCPQTNSSHVIMLNKHSIIFRNKRSQLPAQIEFCDMIEIENRFWKFLQQIQYHKICYWNRLSTSLKRGQLLLKAALLHH